VTVAAEAMAALFCDLFQTFITRNTLAEQNTTRKTLLVLLLFGASKLYNTPGASSATVAAEAMAA